MNKLILYTEYLATLIPNAPDYVEWCENERNDHFGEENWEN